MSASSERLKDLEEYLSHTLDSETLKTFMEPGKPEEEKHQLVVNHSVLAGYAKRCVSQLSDDTYRKRMEEIYPSKANKHIYIINPAAPGGQDRPTWKEAIVTGELTADQLIQNTCYHIEQACKNRPDAPKKSIADKMKIFQEYLGCLARACYEAQNNQDLMQSQKDKHRTPLGELTADPVASTVQKPFLSRFATDAARQNVITTLREATFELLFREGIVTRQLAPLLMDCNSMRADGALLGQLKENQLVPLSQADQDLLKKLNKKVSEDKEHENKLAFDRAFNIAIVEAIQMERLYEDKAYGSETTLQYILRKLQGKITGLEAPPPHSIFVTKQTLSPFNLYRGKHIWALFGEFKDGEWVPTNEPVFYYRTGSWFKSITASTFNRGNVSEACLIFTCIEEFVRFENPHDENDIVDPRDIIGNVSVNCLMYMLQCMKMAMTPKSFDEGLPVYLKDGEGYVYDLASDVNREHLLSFQQGDIGALQKIKPVGKVGENGFKRFDAAELKNMPENNFYQHVFAATYQHYLQNTPTAHAVNPFARMSAKLPKLIQKKQGESAQAWLRLYQNMQESLAHMPATSLEHFDLCAIFLLNGDGALWGKGAKQYNKAAKRGHIERDDNHVIVEPPVNARPNTPPIDPDDDPEVLEHDFANNVRHQEVGAPDPEQEMQTLDHDGHRVDMPEDADTENMDEQARPTVAEHRL